ncbi:hypothetical protein D3C76_1288920 [compost metagenome]
MISNPAIHNITIVPSINGVNANCPVTANQAPIGAEAIVKPRYKWLKYVKRLVYEYDEIRKMAIGDKMKHSILSMPAAKINIV